MNSADLSRPILVTGGIRFGTTWAGKMLSAAPGIGFIMEPFNIRHRRGIFPYRWERQFTYIEAGVDHPCREAYESMLGFRFHYLAGLAAIRRPRSAAGFLLQASTTLFHRVRSSSRPLVKDPIALFSAPWLASTFGMQVLCLIRHPAAFAWSCKRIGEPNWLGSLAAQPKLLESFAPELQRDVLRHSDRGPGDLRVACTLWNVFAATYRSQQAEHPDWHFVTHEELSADPIDRFRNLYRKLEIHAGPRVEKTLRAMVDGKNPRDAPQGVRHHLKRDSRANITAWRRHLSDEEVDLVRRSTERESSSIYDDTTWR